MASITLKLVELLNVDLYFLFKHERSISSNAFSCVSPVETPVAVFSYCCILQTRFAAIAVCAV